MPNSLQPHGLYSPWNSPGQNTGVGSLSLLQGIFPTQGSNPGLPHCRQILYQLSPQGKPIWCIAAAAAAKLLQLCPTLCDPIDGSPPGSPIPGILQARTMEWVAISFSNARKWKMRGKSLSCVQLLVTPWTAAYQALPSMGFSRQEYWSGSPTRAFSDLVYWGVIKKTVIICTAKGTINLDFRPYVKYLKTELQRHLGT